MNDSPIIQIKNLSINNRLNSISAQIMAGEQIHLVGANGSGKSSLISALSGYLAFDGQIEIKGRSLAHYSVRELANIRSCLLQQMVTTPILRVFQYLTLFYTSNEYNNRLFNSLCDDFQLEHLLSKSINRLSGGEWQRVKIVAVFLQVWTAEDLCGKFILLDEPKNNLDILHQASLDKWIKYFCQKAGTVIMSSHDLSHSYEYASGIWLMSQGKLIAAGVPEDVMTETNLSDVFGANIKLTEGSQRQFWQVINFDD